MVTKCLLNILDNDAGNKIAEEMKEQLSKVYEITEFRHDGKKFEYPGIYKAASMAKELSEPVLYIHTKGAGNPNYAQPWVRKVWYYFFVNHNKWLNRHNTGIQCILLGPNKQTWYNAFVINPNVADTIMNEMEISEDRYYYEELPNKLNLDVWALAYDIDPFEIGKTISMLTQSSI